MNDPKLIGKVEKVSDHKYKVSGKSVTIVETNYSRTVFNMPNIPDGKLLGRFNCITTVESR